MHSYVDLEDPTFLEFDYVKSFSDAVAVAWPDHQALDALHVGGGGFTMPRYLAAEYPGTKSTVLEIDPQILKTGRERLGLHTSNALRVKIGDARIGIRTRADRLDRPRRRGCVRQPVGAVAPHHQGVRRRHRSCAQTGRGLHPERDRLPAVPIRARRGSRRCGRSSTGSRRSARSRSSTASTAATSCSWLQIANSTARSSHGSRSRTATKCSLGKRLDRLVKNAPVIRDDYAPIDQWLDADKN